MYIVLFFALTCLSGWLIWRRLCRTRLPGVVCVFLELIGAALVFSAFFWISIYISIYLFQLNDPVFR